MEYRGTSTRVHWEIVLVTLASATFFLAGGCAGPEQTRTVAPDFTAESLRSGGLAVLGVVQVDEVPQVRPPLIDALERVLGVTRHDLRIIPAAKTQAVMGDSTTRFLLLG